MNESLVVIGGVLIMALFGRRQNSQQGTLPGGTTATGAHVPFWNGTGLVLGNGNLILPDGRVVAPDGRVVDTIAPAQTTRLYMATEAQAGGDSTALLRMGLKTLTSPTTLRLVQRVISSGSPRATTGTAQQLLRDPSVVDVAALDFPVDAPISELTRLTDGWLDMDPINLTEIAHDPALIDVFTGVDDFDAIIGMDHFLDVSELGSVSDLGSIGEVGDIITSLPGEELIELTSFVDAGGAIEAGVNAGDVVASGVDAAGTVGANAMPNIPNIGVIGAAIGAAISIGFTLASDMPSDQMAISVALDVANLALVFIPVVGWALAIIAAILKPVIVGLFSGGLSHEQREAIDLRRVLDHLAPLGRVYLRRAVTPSQLYYGAGAYNSGIIAPQGYTPVVSLTYLSVDGRRKTIRPAGGTPLADGRVMHYGVPTLAGTPDDMMRSILAIPNSLNASIQQGIAVEKLEPANKWIEDAILRRAQLIADGRGGDGHALKVLAHVWHIARDPVLDVRSWLNGTNIAPHGIPAAVRPYEVSVEREMPLLHEVLVSLYYNDLAIQWGVTSHRNGADVGDWERLVGLVIQPSWTAYRRQCLERRVQATLSGFLAYLGVRDIIDLRQRVFAGEFPVSNTQGAPMFEQLALEQIRLNRNLDYIARTFGYKLGVSGMAKNNQGLYSNNPGPSDDVMAQHAAQMAATGRTTDQLDEQARLAAEYQLQQQYGTVG